MKSEGQKKQNITLRIDRSDKEWVRKEAQRTDRKEIVVWTAALKCFQRLPQDQRWPTDGKINGRS